MCMPQRRTALLTCCVRWRRRPANTRLQLLLFGPPLPPPPNMNCTQNTAHMRASTHKYMAKNRRLHVKSRM